MFRWLWAAAAASLAVGADGARAASAPVAPEAASAAASTTYPPDFFSQFAPQTALDMALRVPGFSLDDGADRRGFAGTGGNVLVNGAQPTAKSASIRDVLARIPAANVERLELIRGGGAGQDTAGQALLLNVVTRESETSVVWEALVEMDEKRRVTPGGDVSWSGRLGAVELTAAIEGGVQYGELTGVRVFRDGAGAVTRVATDLSPRTFRELEGALSLKAPLGGGVLSVDLQADRFGFQNSFTVRAASPAGVPIGLDYSTRDEREREREISAAYSRTIGPVTAELIALAARRTFANDERFESFSAAGALLSAVSQSQDRASGESILRATLGLALDPRHSLQFGADGALNTLETQLSLVEERSGVSTPILLPQANVEIDETRAEAFLTHTWRPAQRFTFQSTLAYERSQIRQAGAAAEATLEYWKPAVQASLRFAERNEARLSLTRDVDQLDFDDFVSSAALLDDRVAGGNPGLRPEARWEFEAVLDLRYGEQGALTLTAFRTEAEDVTDVAPIGGFDAPANIGEGEAFGLRIGATISLDALLPGARIDITAVAQEAEVTDPTTGRPRTASDFRETEVEAAFRQDLAAAGFAWGVDFDQASEAIDFRARDTDAFEDEPLVGAFVETTRLPGGTKLRLEGFNLLDADFRRERRFFSPDRTGALVRSEIRDRNSGRVLILSLSGAF